MPPWSSQSYSDTAARAKQLAGKSLFTLGSGLCTAGVAVAKAAAAGYQTLTADRSDREKVTCVRVGEIEWRDPGQHSDHRLPVCLLGYETGFQVWSLEYRDVPAELVSIRREGAVRWLEPVPQPRAEDPLDGPLFDTRPLLAVVPAPVAAAASGPEAANGSKQPAAAAAVVAAAAAQQQQHRVQLYSLRTQGYVKTLSFSSEVQAVLCNSRVLVVALRGQLQAFDATTLQHTLSCVTYCLPLPLPLPSRQPLQQAQQHQQGERRLQARQEGVPEAPCRAPCALGPRWLAYAADQAVQPNGSLAKAQRLPLHRRDSSGSSHSSAALAIPGHAASMEHAGAGAGAGGLVSGSPGSGLTGAAVAEAAKDLAKRSGQHLAAGLAAAGAAGYKFMSSQIHTWRSGVQQGAQVQQADASVAGTVVVRDVVSRQVVCHFRAHTSPLAALQFSPDGVVLATASVHGHNVNLFRIVPPAPTGGAGADGDAPCGGGSGGVGGGPGVRLTQGYAVRLFRLHRGVTPAIIQAISFAPDASWAAVTSGRGTHHVFHLAPTGAAPVAGALQPAAAASGPMDSLQRLSPQPGAGGVAVGGVGLLLGGGGAGLDGLDVQPPPGRLEEGVAGQGVKLVAVGRAGGKAGLLGSGIAGAATHAALSVYGQHSGVLPAAAAVLPAKPGSPRALASSHQLAADATPLSLLVVSWEGQLTRHVLRAADARLGPHGMPPSNGHYLSAVGRDGAAMHARQGAPALQEEARWDICRQHGWPEREEIPACLLPARQAQAMALDVHSSSGSVLGPEPRADAAPLAHGMPPEQGAAAAHAAAAGAAAAAAADPAWLAQAERGPGAEGAAPVWADPQFRFFALPSQPQQAQQATAYQAPQLPAWGWGGEGLAGSPGQGAHAASPLLSSSPASSTPYLLNGYPMQYSRPGSSLSDGAR